LEPRAMVKTSASLKLSDVTDRRIASSFFV
jgi:hypothetical protein